MRPLKAGYLVACLVLASGCVENDTQKSEPTNQSQTHRTSVEPEDGEADLDQALRLFEALDPQLDGAVLPESTRANELIGECLEEFGFPVEYAGAGGVYSRPSDAQHDRYQEVLDVCFEAMEQTGYVRLADTEATRTLRYEAYLEAYKCLTEHGEEVNPPPSLDSFIDGETWSPFDNVPVVISENGTLTGPAIECAVP